MSTAERETQLTHLEHLVQRLQDSMHREGAPQGKRIPHLAARIESAELSGAPTPDR